MQTAYRVAALLFVCGVAILAAIAAQPEKPPAGGQAPSVPGGASAGVEPLVTIEVKDGFRVITSNGIPNHETGKFPNRGNPNTIRAQKYQFRVPEKPVKAEKTTKLGHQPFGVALNGIVFDPGTAEFWKDDPRAGWNIEAIPPAGVQSRNLGLDDNHAHVQPNGAYHYHASPTGLVAWIVAKSGASHGAQMILVGWAADGFPIYDHHGYSNTDDAQSALKELKSSYRLKKEARPEPPKGPGGAADGVYTRDWEYIAGSGDLDECNGRTGVTPEFPRGTYYYIITGDFPYIPRAAQWAAARQGASPGTRWPTAAAAIKSPIWSAPGPVAPRLV
jgi:hypothetical protein